MFQLPRECRVFAAIQPGAQWGWNETLANKTNYLLELLVWMKTKDASKKVPRNKPKPFMPDFMKGTAPPSEINKEAEAQTTDDIRDILSKPRL